MAKIAPSTPFFSQGVTHTVGPNPAIVTGEIGSWDDRVLESGDCFEEGGTYYWYYHSYSTWAKTGHQIFLATASDPLGPWTKYGEIPLLTKSGRKHDSGLVACPKVVVDGDRFAMVYLSAGDGPIGWGWSVSLAYADHPTGPWIKYSENPIIEHQRMCYPAGLVQLDGAWYMYGTEPDTVQLDFGRMHVATATALEGPWEVQEDPVLAEGEKGEWDEGGFSEFEVIHYNGLFHAFYGGSEFANVSDLAMLGHGPYSEEAETARLTVRESIGYAYSHDGIEFT